MAAMCVLTNARPFDRREIAARLGEDWESRARDDIAGRDFDIAFSADFEPVAIGGIHFATDADGNDFWEAWLIATPRFPEVALAVTRWAKEALSDLAGDSAPILCRSHAENRAAHRWLEHLGFRKSRDLPAFGLTREDHVEFVYDR